MSERVTNATFALSVRAILDRNDDFGLFHDHLLSNCITVFEFELDQDRSAPPKTWEKATPIPTLLRSVKVRNFQA